MSRPTILLGVKILEQPIVTQPSEHIVNQVRYTVISQFTEKNSNAEDLADKVKRLILNDAESLKNM